MRGSSSRLSIPSLNRAAHYATLLYFVAWLPFAYTSSSVMVCAETPSLALILIYARNSIYCNLNFLNISEVTKYSINFLIHMQKFQQGFKLFIQSRDI